jgi:hypothetical protein
MLRFLTKKEAIKHHCYNEYDPYIDEPETYAALIVVAFIFLIAFGVCSVLGLT